jgi:aminopeptidase N
MANRYRHQIAANPKLYEDMMAAYDGAQTPVDLPKMTPEGINRDASARALAARALTDHLDAQKAAQIGINVDNQAKQNNIARQMGMTRGQVMAMDDVSASVAKGDVASASAKAAMYAEQYGPAFLYAARNMTDRLAALTALVQGDPDPQASGATALLQDFEARWRHEALALNLWFSVQAQRPHAGALEDVRALLGHRDFELRNPNRVRALTGAFCSGNAPGFHRADGAGYRFLGEQVKVLDPMNPQVAARLLAPLTRWRRHAPLHADGMRAVLESLRALPALSPDCFEVVNKSLAVPGG